MKKKNIQLQFIHAFVMCMLFQRTHTDFMISTGRRIIHIQSRYRRKMQATEKKIAQKNAQNKNKNNVSRM